MDYVAMIPSVYAYYVYVHPYVPYSRIFGYCLRKITEPPTKECELERYDVVRQRRDGVVTTTYYIESDYTEIDRNLNIRNEPVWL